jgi:hypothetical protein
MLHGKNVAELVNSEGVKTYPSVMAGAKNVTELVNNEGVNW